MGATLLSDAFRIGGTSTDTQGFTNMGDTPIEMIRFEPQSSDAASIS